LISHKKYEVIILAYFFSFHFSLLYKFKK